MAPPAIPTQQNRSALERRLVSLPPNVDYSGVPLAGGLPRSSLGTSLSSSQGWQQIECKEEPTETAPAVSGKPAPPVPPTTNKRAPPVPKGTVARELEAQIIEDRSSYGSAAIRMSNIAKVQDIERRASGEPPPKLRRFMDGAIRPINPNDPPMVSISPNIPAAIRAISHGDFREAVETAERAQQTARDAARDAAMAANRPK